MDYHSDRFEDHSLMVRDSDGRLVALLPMEVTGDIVASHRGLTYGGLITPPAHVYADRVFEIFEAICDYLHSEGYRQLIYKPIPYIYTKQPADDDIYAMFRLGARMTGCGLSSAIAMRADRVVNESTRQAVSAADSIGLKPGLSDAWEAFWILLQKCLRDRHGVAPVHTIDEIRLLAGRFPDNIKLFTTERAGELLAGAVVYLAGRVAHIQYIATSAEGRCIKALPQLLNFIYSYYQSDFDYLDFGVSTTDSGRHLNEGLLLQKSGLGARSVAYTEYTLEL
ncbi:MAG: GNAT family N-acetyltransferase [Roseburia sp.]|nr:GNAT family N-acetyltransferase [Roseburia sp.]